MNDEDFWSLIERTRRRARWGWRGSATSRQARAVAKALKSLPDAEVIAFRRKLYDKVALAHDWGIWAAGYAAAGGMSDDSFRDFRVWLVHQGHAAFDRVRADPDSLAELAWDSRGEDFSAAEDLGYLADEALEERGVDIDGLDDDVQSTGDPSEPAGTPFPEDDDEWFAAHLPRLWARTESARSAAGGFADDDFSVMETQIGSRARKFTGLTVDRDLTGDVLDRFRRQRYDYLGWAPRTDEADLSPLLPFAGQFRGLKVYAPNATDDSLLQRFPHLRMLESITRASNPLDLTDLPELEDLEINDRTGLTGLDAVPLRRLRLFSCDRSLADFESMESLEELLLSSAGGAPLQATGRLPGLELLSLHVRRLGNTDGLYLPDLKYLTVQISEPSGELDVSFLAATPGLTRLVVRGPVEVTGTAGLEHLTHVRWTLQGGARFGPSASAALPKAWKQIK